MAREDPKNIWFLAEMDGQELREVAFELASEGRRLADKLGERLCAVILAEDLKGSSDVLSSFGVDTIYHAKLKRGGDACTHVISHLMLGHNPKLMLMEATPLGSELASGIAARNEIGIITNCMIMRLNDRGCFEVTKMIHGDHVYATFEAPISSSLVVTVIPGSFESAKKGSGKSIEIVEETTHESLPASRIRYLEFIKGNPKEIDITEAEIIVAVGRGVGDQAGFRELEKMAKLIEGSLGGSRVAVDLGLLPYERQIGQTGKTVAPKLMINCGISGAFEYTTGIKDSKLIISINQDAKAPIAKISDLYLVGDLQIIVPEIIKRFGNM